VPNLIQMSQETLMNNRVLFAVGIVIALITSSVFISVVDGSYI